MIIIHSHAIGLWDHTDPAEVTFQDSLVMQTTVINRIQGYHNISQE